ncbi:MAG: Bifunctional folate synthesis protein [Candidatus Aerophobetes bacterium ADurb.Bin490]|nr:MAG: Bifunctional folate synthesis protein [Candidatus Aerophobetes bacterium ADurb.Bin490]HPI02638.1 2-amino-4-hydroxy-6-hydroxymethyldihydropteridine diphosphokinase [Candidatus Goldiibacteriota bacterium]HPN64972.1 2-amino-4-hydroxy-6-hydroxymethyldihydropteridine diphosphokinase [Candidatus Goldiibacteriota bacterium]HRQ43880.1 2-amino-4-hydroxy-6-hydroxymethyldihydropteridine diphosphokinase [Candidatus Goldiibacteriota bacterium]
MKVFLSLGANKGDKKSSLKEALKRLGENKINVRKISSVYLTEPFGYKKQPDFLNIAVQAETKLTPFDLLDTVKRIESEMGRKPDSGRRWGPRIIDIDIIFYGNIMINSGRLTIPHAGLAERLFVLVPLDEIAGGFTHPAFKLSVKELLKTCKKEEKILRIGALNE